MLNDQKILEKIQKMPAPLKAELLHYLDYLISQYGQQHTNTEQKRP